MFFPDEELLLPLPAVPEVYNNHLTGRSLKMTLVLVVILATITMGKRCALWSRDLILWQDYCVSMLQSEFTHPL
jgi:hypothetical protein